MSRRRARELSFHMIFENESSGISAREMTDRYFSDDYLSSLSEECSVFSKIIEDDQKEYLLKSVEGVIDKKEDLESYIDKYSVGWNVSRISTVSRSLIKLCMYEIKYMNIPVGASVNEALELVKKYDNGEAVPFVNGVLAGFIKNEINND